VKRKTAITKIIVVSGLPGSGKSTVAEGIAERLALPIFSVDPIESSIIKSGIMRSFETGLAAYLVAETLASEQLNLGLSVIIDAVNSVKEARDMWRDLADRHGACLIIVECVLDWDIHKQRIESRVRNMQGIPEVTWADVEKRRNEYLKWEEKRLVLDTSDSPANNLEKALEYISSNA
jgi:predicted kinase